jgi:hypothetical protein
MEQREKTLMQIEKCKMQIAHSSKLILTAWGRGSRVKGKGIME